MLDEPDAAAISTALEGFTAIVSSRLLRVELHRLGRRTGISHEELASWLDTVALVPISDSILTHAETITPASVATLDAIHLATALELARLDVLSSMLTFDARLADGAHEHGLTVLAPS